MLTGKTSTGFEFEISEDILDDYELLEVLCAIDNGDSSKTTKMVDLLLGQKQKEDLKNHIRKNGKVSAKSMLAEVIEIFNSCNKGKNF